MPAQMRTHPYVHCRMFADTGWHKTHTFTMLISYRHAVFICKFTELHTVKAHLLHTLTINVLYIHVGTHKRMLFTGGHPPAVQPTVSLPTPTQHMHTHTHALSLSLTHTHTQGEGTVQWATGVEHKVSGSSTKFPSRSQLVACLLGRELHHTERRPAWSATSDLSARESAGGKERQTWRERQTEREWGLWSTSLYDSGWWNHSRTDWKMLALWMGDSVTIMCEFVCVCLLFCRS